MEDRFGSSPDAVMSSVPLSRDMTLAEFVVLGVNALVYVRQVTGKQLAKMLSEPEIASKDTFQLVIAADGALMLVTDDPEELDNWLDEMNFGVVSLH